jgi:hypothetical protein
LLAALDDKDQFVVAGEGFVEGFEPFDLGQLVGHHREDVGVEAQAGQSHGGE